MSHKILTLFIINIIINKTSSTQSIYNYFLIARLGFVVRLDSVARAVLVARLDLVARVGSLSWKDLFTRFDLTEFLDLVVEKLISSKFSKKEYVFTFN